MEPQKAKKYIYQIELMLEGATDGEALEKLLHTLNTSAVKDYRILKGVRLGSLLDQARTEEGNGIPLQGLPSKADQPAAQQDSHNEQIYETFMDFIRDSTLVRLTVLKEKGGKISMPCRILNFDQTTGHVTVYHVDEKSVYLFTLEEIEDFKVV
ncbi:hypothetical protein [Paenibacillus gansuensis]|uniref:Spore coat protein n=1 Tax=Paenibacillus gansuensis TaxID=306542 RepID=A0ABW5PEL5_9BACL